MAVQVPGASVIRDHELAAVADIFVKRAGQRIIADAVNLVGQDHGTRGVQVAHRVEEVGIANQLEMQAFLRGCILPDTHLRTVGINAIGDEQYEVVNLFCRRRDMVAHVSSG